MATPTQSAKSSPEAQSAASGKPKRKRSRAKKGESRAVAVAQPGAPKYELPANYEPPKTTLELIDRAARDPQIDPAKLRELLAIKRDQENREAELTFNMALRDAQGEVPRISRDKKADKYKYATLEKITKEVNPIMAKHGFSLSYGTADSPLNNHYRITCKLSHVLGHSREYFVDIPADLTGDKGAANKSPTKAFGSTMSYGRRYLIVMIFNIAITNEDDDGAAASSAGVEPISEEQLKYLINRCDNEGVDKRIFVEWLNKNPNAPEITGLAQLTADRFDEATAGLDVRKQQKARDGKTDK